jgi:hypothetical protein
VGLEITTIILTCYELPGFDRSVHFHKPLKNIQSNTIIMLTKRGCVRLLLFCLHIALITGLLSLDRGIPLPSALTDSSSLLRLLTVGDFEEFNRLFADARINLPNADVSRSGLNVKIRNLYCADISIGDIQTNFTETNATTLVASLFVNPFSFRCFADYSYSFSFFVRGSGQMEAKARNSRIQTEIAFYSPFPQEPPSTTAVVACSTRIDIYDMTFRGGVVARILDLMENLIDSVIEREVQDGTYCSL